jgi:hypothetical protein
MVSTMPIHFRLILWTVQVLYLGSIEQINLPVMSKLTFAATVSFSLKSAKNEEYETLYKELAKSGLSKFVTGVDGNNKEVTYRLPETTVYGKFDSDTVANVREHVRAEVLKAYAAAKVSGEFFTAVGGTETTWGFNTVS